MKIHIFNQKDFDNAIEDNLFDATIQDWFDSLPLFAELPALPCAADVWFDRRWLQNYHGYRV